MQQSVLSKLMSILWYTLIGAVITDGVSIDEFISILDTYIHWYAESRIKMSLGGLSPLQYRKALGYAA